MISTVIPLVTMIPFMILMLSKVTSPSAINGSKSSSKNGSLKLKIYTFIFTKISYFSVVCIGIKLI